MSFANTVMYQARGKLAFSFYGEIGLKPTKAQQDEWPIFMHRRPFSCSSLAGTRSGTAVMRDACIMYCLPTRVQYLQLKTEKKTASSPGPAWGSCPGTLSSRHVCCALVIPNHRLRGLFARLCNRQKTRLPNLSNVRKFSSIPNNNSLCVNFCIRTFRGGTKYVDNWSLAGYTCLLSKYGFPGESSRICELDIYVR